MLNVANETVWTSLAHKVPGALGTDHCGYGLDGMLCAFVVSWRLTALDIIRSQRRSKPRATAFAPHFIIPQHYSDVGLWNMHYPIRRSHSLNPRTLWRLYRLIYIPPKTLEVHKTHSKTYFNMWKLHSRRQFSSFHHIFVLYLPKDCLCLFRVMFDRN